MSRSLRRRQNVGVLLQSGRFSRLKRRRLQVGASDASDLPQPSKVGNGARAVHGVVGNREFTRKIGEHVFGHSAIGHQCSDRIPLAHAKHRQRALEGANARTGLWRDVHFAQQSETMCRNHLGLGKDRTQIRDDHLVQPHVPANRSVFLDRRTSMPLGGV